MLRLEWILAIFASVALPRTFGTAPVSLACDGKPSFALRTAEGRRALVQDCEFSLTYNPEDVLIRSSPETDLLNVSISNAAVDFRGDIKAENWELDGKPADSFYWSSVGSISLSAAVLPEGDRADYRLANCRLFLSPNSNSGGNLVTTTGEKILRYAEFCLASQLCENFANARNGKAQTMAVQSPPALGHSDNICRFRININKLIDIGLREMREKLIASGQTTIEVPEIHESFHTGKGIFKTTGEFDTEKGRFENLATLHRTADAELSQKNQKYSASAGFGLSIANLNFHRYQLRFGIIKVSGRLMAHVDGIALAAKVSVDYGTPTCTKSLDYVKVTNLGHVNIQITGLGKLNSLMSKLVSWVSKDWKDDIIDKIETNLKKVAIKQLEKFNCENYRPSNLFE